MPELIVKVSPELIVISDTVQVLGSVHVPPIDSHDFWSETIPPVACASWENEDNAKIKITKIER